jgi:hypothetical protein
MNTGVQQKALKTKLTVDRPDCSNNFNYKTDCGQNASCITATSRKSVTWQGVADMNTFLRNTWNTLPESYQLRVYRNILTTVKPRIQQVENPTPAVVLSVKAASVNDAIPLESLTSEVAIEEAEMRSSDPNIPIHSN